MSEKIIRSCFYSSYLSCVYLNLYVCLCASKRVKRNDMERDGNARQILFSNQTQTCNTCIRGLIKWVEEEIVPGLGGENKPIYPTSGVWKKIFLVVLVWTNPTSQKCYQKSVPSGNRWNFTSKLFSLPSETRVKMLLVNHNMPQGMHSHLQNKIPAVRKWWHLTCLFPFHDNFEASRHFKGFILGFYYIVELDFNKIKLYSVIFFDGCPLFLVRHFITTCLFLVKG